ncbi:hypothetical protein CUMW_046940 [Citrus unshiu]|nr:hypothetical protein CUMW_046940 [Citrus unshiu]
MEWSSTMEMVGVGMVAEVEAVEEAVVVFVGMEEATVVGICNKNLVVIMTMVEVLLLLKAVGEDVDKADSEAVDVVGVSDMMGRSRQQPEP